MTPIPLKSSQCIGANKGADTDLKSDKLAVFLGNANTDSKGHLVKHAPPTPSSIKQAEPSSSHDLFHEKSLFCEKTRPYNSGLPSVRMNPAEFSRRPSSQKPELIFPSSRHHGQSGRFHREHDRPVNIENKEEYPAINSFAISTENSSVAGHSEQPIKPSISKSEAVALHGQRTIPSGTISNSRDKATKELRDELIKTAGIPNSIYQRQYPNVVDSDSFACREGEQDKKQIKKTVEGIMNQYELWSDNDFKKHLKSNKCVSEMFSPASSMWNIPKILLEFVVHYVFHEDPILSNISFSGAQGYRLSYRDHEILKVHPLVRTEFIRGGEAVKQIEVKYTYNNKPIIQQQATKCGTYAAAAMLMHQYERSFSIDALKSTSQGNDDRILRALSSAGLSPVKVETPTIERLENAVKLNGSAIVTVKSGTGWSTVIVDVVTDAFVLIRDPYHGWEVEIRRDAFEKSWENDAIQVNGGFGK